MITRSEIPFTLAFPSTVPCRFVRSQFFVRPVWNQETSEANLADLSRPAQCPEETPICMCRVAVCVCLCTRVCVLCVTVCLVIGITFKSLSDSIAIPPPRDSERANGLCGYPGTQQEGESRRAEQEHQRGGETETGTGRHGTNVPCIYFKSSSSSSSCTAGRAQGRAALVDRSDATDMLLVSMLGSFRPYANSVSEVVVLHHICF